MELFYIDNIVNNDQFDAEYYYFIINYLIGEKIHIHSNFGMYIYGTINANQLTQIELIDYHESYWIHQKKLPKEELQGIFVIKDYYIEHHKYIKVENVQNRMVDNINIFPIISSYPILSH